MREASSPTRAPASLSPLLSASRPPAVVWLPSTRESAFQSSLPPPSLFPSAGSLSPSPSLLALPPPSLPPGVRTLSVIPARLPLSSPRGVRTLSGLPPASLSLPRRRHSLSLSRPIALPLSSPLPLLSPALHSPYLPGCKIPASVSLLPAAALSLSPSLAVAHPPVPFVSRSRSSLSLALGLSSLSRRPPVDLLPPSQFALPSTSCLPLSSPSRRPPASLSVRPPVDLLPPPQSSLPSTSCLPLSPPSHLPLSSPQPAAPELSSLPPPSLFSPSSAPCLSSLPPPSLFPPASGTPSLALSLEVSLPGKHASLPAPLPSFCSRFGGSDPHPRRRRRRRPSPLSRPPSGPLALSSSWSGWQFHTA